MALPLVSYVSYIKSSNQFHLLVISQKKFLKFSSVFSRENSIKISQLSFVRRFNTQVFFYPFFKYWYLREAARMGVKQAPRSIDVFPRAE
ncbi:unnamed protein product [Brassica rapa subsp. trilocularis]